jgi:outer membrane biosynthesis protein TonB
MRSPILLDRLQRVSFAALLIAAAACAPDNRGEAADAAAIAGGSPVARRAASEHLSSITGLSHMPTPVSQSAFGASIRRHYPEAMRRAGRGGEVLVDVRLDETGRVQEVDVVRERKTSADEHRIVVIGKAPGSNTEEEREVQLNYDPEAFGAAAQAALREVRFRPALREGKAVPYTLRMTVSFTPADAR